MIYSYNPEDDCEMCSWYIGIPGLPVYVQGDYIIISSVRYNSNNDPNLHIYKISDLLYERKIPEDDTSIQYYHIEGDHIIILDGEGTVYLYKISDPSYEKIISIECEIVWVDENYVYIYKGEELRAILFSVIEEAD